MIVMFGAASPPVGWLLCDGSAVSRTQYPALFTAIGTTWGPGDGTTTFNLPDFFNFFPYGSLTPNQTGGSADAVLPAHTHTMAHTHAETAHTHTINHGHSASSANEPGHTHAVFRFRQPTGASGPAEENGVCGAMQGSGVLTNAQTGIQGAHSHAITVNNFNGQSGSAGGGTTGPSSTANTGQAGQTATNANLPPYRTVPFIIRADP